MDKTIRTVLHVGCGPQHILGQRGFDAESWREIRLDIDPSVQPDILGSMTNLSAVESGTVDAIYSSHNLEHLPAHEVPLALGEFLRVCSPNGYLVLTCPDAQSVAALVAQDKLLEPVYHTAAGFPIAPVDILWGWRAALAQGQCFMAHRIGFTRRVLSETLKACGFASVATMRGTDFALYAVATKTPQTETALRELIRRHFAPHTPSAVTERERERERERDFAPPEPQAPHPDEHAALVRAAPEECSPPLSLQRRYLQTLKKSLMGEFYVENDARLLYLAWRIQTRQSIDWRVVTDPRTYFPRLLQHIESRKNRGEVWYFLPVKKADGTNGVLDLRNFTDFTYTMIGRKRMDNLETCLDVIRQENIPGDLMETGVCRGGAVIFMKGYLNAYAMKDRLVWAADSYEGLPAPSHEEDAGHDLSRDRYPVLAIGLERVKEAFARYDLLDESVCFLKGWFRDTLPCANVQRLALLRLDGDLYESTMDALRAMYDRVTPGGFVIVDDYHTFEPCRKAVDEFRTGRNIADPLVQIDPSSVYWRKSCVQ